MFVCVGVSASLLAVMTLGGGCGWKTLYMSDFLILLTGYHGKSMFKHRQTQGYIKAVPRLQQGYIKATPRLHQGYIKAAARLR